MCIKLCKTHQRPKKGTKDVNQGLLLGQGVRPLPRCLEREAGKIPRETKPDSQHDGATPSRRPVSTTKSTGARCSLARAGPPPPGPADFDYSPPFR